MLNIQQPLKLNKTSIAAANLCDQFSEEDLVAIGEEVSNGYEADEGSRKDWMRRNEAGMNLALQVVQEKSFPWPNCSNVAFPIVTIAAMQFHARAYPAIIGTGDIVRCDVLGNDPDGMKTARADRVATHMSWQLQYEDLSWEEQEDKALLNLSIVGTNFKKSYRNQTRGHNVSELVLAKDLVLNYWSKSVEECPRKTHLIPKFQNEIHENVMRGIWKDVTMEGWYNSTPVPKTSEKQRQQDNRQGVKPSRPDDTTSRIFLEQHVDLDLDCDGYAEPYVVTVERESRCVVRIVLRFDDESAIERVAAGPHKGKIIKITPSEYFTKTSFIPSPDGGIYDIGFGVFLGPLNESVNSLLNMLLDAGTLQTTAGGFIGRGAKMRSGVQTSSPFEWKRVECTGDDLRKAIVPATVQAPSDVLFQLLSLLIQYASRVSGTTDITVGENPGQNTPAQTTQTMVEMGQKIYTAIFKRVWRARKAEFQKLFLLNGKFMSLTVPSVGGATRADYLGTADQISPVADPNVVSESQQLQRAMTLKQLSATSAGYDRDEVEIRMLKALKVPSIDAVFKRGAQPPPDPNLLIVQAKVDGDLKGKQLDNETKMKALELKQQEFQADLQKFTVEMQETIRMNNAKIIELDAQAQQEAANAQTEQAYAQVALMNTEISQRKMENEHLLSQIDMVLAAIKLNSDHQLKLKSLTKTPKGQE